MAKINPNTLTKKRITKQEKWVKDLRTLSEDRVFSLIPLDGKVPQEKGWTQWCRKKRPFRAADFKGTNAGICTGPASGLIAVDIDDRESFVALKNSLNLALPKTLKVRTGNGGLHLYYRYPEGGEEWGNKSLKHPAFKKHGIFDIKADGGVVVAPGSVHPVTRKKYEIIADREIAPCPKWILDFIKGNDLDTKCLLQNPLPKGADKAFIDSLPVGKKVKSKIQTEFPVGQRSEAIFSVISSLLRAGCDDQTIRFVLNHNPIGGKCREKGSEWLDAEIERARFKIKPEDDSVESVPDNGEVDDLVDQIEKSMVRSRDFLKEEIPKPKHLIYPILSETDIVMIYAKRGVGKTWLGLIISTLLTRIKKINDLPEIGRWKLENKAGVLYVDGEMNTYYLQERLKHLEKTFGKESKELYPLYLLSAHRWSRNGSLNISRPECRNAIYRLLERHDELKVLVLDNLASLAPGIDENAKRDWDPVNQWLLSLRRLGKSVVFVHHAGKNNQQRGTIGREDNLDTVIRISKPSGYKTEDGANFDIKLEKFRNTPPGKSLKPFRLKVESGEEGGVTWDSIEERSNPKYVEVVNLLLNSDDSQSQKDLGEKIGVKSQMFSKYKKRAIDEGLMDSDRNPTMKGLKFLSKHNLPVPEPFAKKTDATTQHKEDTVKVKIKTLGE